MSADRIILIDLDRDALTAARVSVSADSARVEAWTSVRRPSSLDSDDADSVGVWLARALSDAGITGGRCVFAVPRSEVVLKLLGVPGGAALDEGEIVEIVRLQMLRQTAVAIENAVVDYVPLVADAGQAGERTVLVGAIPGDRVEWRRGVAEAAGLKLAGVRLRAAGVAELAAGSRDADAGATLGISIGPASVELALCDRGDLVFARTVELGEPGKGGARAAARIAVEAKRTAMSLRVGPRTPEVGSVVVLGRDQLAKDVALACAEELGVPGAAVWPPIEGLDAPPAPDERALLPLVGLARRHKGGRAMLDFANPRRAPDRGAKRRQLALAGVFVLILLLGGGWLLGSRRLDALRGRLEAAVNASNEGKDEYLRAMVSDARARHLETWGSVDTDWLARLDEVLATMPGPDRALLDSVSGAAETGVSFSSGKSVYPGKWSVEQRLAIDLTGTTSGPGVAVDLRARLLELGAYRVETRGPDVENAFAFELTTPGGGGTP